MGGDRLSMDIELGRGAHAVLTTPSAIMGYRTDSGPTSQHTTVNLAENAVLEYLSDHVIPHPGAILDQSLSVNMGPGSRAIISDGFSTGRIARQEKWLFKTITTELLINRAGQPICRDRTQIWPEAWTPSRIGGLDGANYVATMPLCADSLVDWEQIAKTFTDRFEDGQDSAGGTSVLANGGYLLPYYTHTSHCLNQVTRTLWTKARLILLGQPRLDFRKG